MPLMNLTIIAELTADLAAYADVSIAFSVTEMFGPPALAALRRGEWPAAAPVSPAYDKDYDRLPGNHPTEWPVRFDTAEWLTFGAHRGGRRVGGAVLIAQDAAMEMLRERPGNALLWDLRVEPSARGQGAGTALLREVEKCAVQFGAHALCVETQQINVPACRLYHRQGFQLARATPGAYADLPGEVQLIWSKTLR
jgi:GNAT superfamily N-acetyltransferase